MKKFARIFASSALRSTLFAAAITAAIVSILGAPTTIKKTLSDSKIYDTLVDNALKEANKKAAEEGKSGGDNPLDKPEVQQAAKTALTPQVLQNSTEKVLDGVYDWLNGKAALPTYNVDLTAVKQNFIQAAGDTAATRVAGLPTCTKAELQALNGQDDPFVITCRPATLTPAAAKDKVVSNLGSNEDFLKDPVLNANTLKNDQGENVFAKADAAPKAFQKAKTAPLVFLLLSLLLGVAVFFLSEDYRQGTKRLARVFLATGVVVSVIGVLAGAVFSKVAAPTGALGKKIENDLEASFLDAARHLSSTFSKTILLYGVAYVILGGGTLLAVKFLWKQSDTKPKPAPKDKKLAGPGSLV